jgi:aryl-alcohol dehydrogenase-like predicted oxidoreductase
VGCGSLAASSVAVWAAARCSRAARRLVSSWLIVRAPRMVEDRGVSMAEVALAWVTGRPAVSSTILGARTMGQLETNLRSARLHLSAAETAALDAASDPRATDYPYGELGVEQRARSLPGGH